MKLFNFSTFSSSDKLTVSKETIREYKKVSGRMKGLRFNAEAMHVLTNETIYKVTMATIDKIRPSLKKVIRCGAGHYKPNSKSARLFGAAHKLVKEFENISVMMELKQMPSRSDRLISDWLQQAKVDAALSESLKEAKKEEAVEEKKEDGPAPSDGVAEIHV